jgi:hypothetical protein
MKARPVVIVLTAVSLSVLAGAAVAGEPRAVIELFTSQGCSSCPPADKLLGELAHDRSVIALSLPVDYWDYLGWKDTLALKGHSIRQRGYAETRGDRAVYTPQVVVNGVVHALGSDKDAIEKAIADSRAKSDALSLPVGMKVDNGKVTVTLPASDQVEGLAQIWLCPVTDKIPVTIERGENGGHKLTYYDVVRRWVKLGQWSGKAETFSMTVEDVLKGIGGEVDRVAVLVQKQPDGKPGMMLGAAEANLH